MSHIVWVFFTFCMAFMVSQSLPWFWYETYLVSIIKITLSPKYVTSVFLSYDELISHHLMLFTGSLEYTRSVGFMKLSCSVIAGSAQMVVSDRTWTLSKMKRKEREFAHEERPASKACASSSHKETVESRLETAILTILKKRKPTSTLWPSEAGEWIFAVLI